jgi:hypothetical protein
MVDSAGYSHGVWALYHFPCGCQHPPHDKLGRYCGSRVARAMMHVETRMRRMRRDPCASPCRRRVQNLYDSSQSWKAWSERVIREVVVSSSHAPRIAGITRALRGDAGLWPRGLQTHHRLPPSQSAWRSCLPSTRKRRFHTRGTAPHFG